MAQPEEQVAYARYVKEATDNHQTVLPYGRWQAAQQIVQGSESEYPPLDEIDRAIDYHQGQINRLKAFRAVASA